MWFSIILFTIFFPCSLKSLAPFDPWLLVNGTCAISMDTCRFELRATNAMTMFYKQLFRVVATSNGVLQKYDNPNQAYLSSDILTGDGYPKLVRDIDICRLEKHSEYNMLYSLGIHIQ